MAEYQGKKVTLDKPSRITKGEAGYGRKKFKVYVKAGDKVKKVMFGDPNLSIKGKVMLNVNHSGQGINVQLLGIKQKQGTGVVRCGKNQRKYLI